MPLRSKLLTKRWLTAELPIPPFLAPRVFTQWPSFGRRAHTEAQTAHKYNTNEQSHDIKLPKCDEDDQPPRKQDFTLLRLAGKAPGRPKRRAGKAVDEALTPSSSWANISNIYGASGNSAEESKEASTELSSDGLFHKKYEDIWDTGKTDSSQLINVKAERNMTKEKVPASESGQSLRRVRLQVETIVNGRNKANFHEGHDAVEYRTGGELKAPQFRHGEAVESLQQAQPTEGTPEHHNTLPTTLIPQFRATGKKAFRRPIQLNNHKGLQCRQGGKQTELNLTHRKASPAKFGSRPQTKATRTTVFWWKRLRLRAPTKYVRWSPGQGYGGFSFWQTRFAGLSLRLNGLPERIAFTNHMPEPCLHESLIAMDSSVSLRKAWEALSVEKRGDIWPELMLLALEEYPTKVLKLLVATYIEPYPPKYGVSDCLDYIISYYLSNRNIRNSKNALEIFTSFEHMLRVGPPGHIHLSQKSVHLLLKNLADVFVGMLFQVLTEFGHPLSKYTLMHFPSKVRLSKGHDERIDVLRRLWEAGSDFNSPEVSSVCATLLQKKNRSSEVSYSDSEIFEFMLECGMKPNIIIYNVLLQNSLEGGDPETAWQIHDMMVKNGIETDGYTYSLLLTDAKLRGDRPSIQRILKLVGERGVQNAHVATDILHTIYLFRRNYEVSPHWEEKGRPAKVFERMLTVYCQYFRLEPLTHIIPWLGTMYPNCANSTGTSSELAPSSNDTLMDPNIPTLVVMLTALLRERTEPVPVLHFYNHFCDLVKAGDVTATALAKSTHVYNIILMALGRFAETLALCPRLIGDMLSQNAGGTSVDGSLQSAIETEPPPENAPAAQQRLHPKPDVYTWSILLKIFMDHGQPRAAEKVLAMMEERNVWPNQVTWNSLIVGYARMQDMSMTVDAVDRLKRSGCDIDGVTMKGLSYFQNRRALVEAMRASEVRNPGRSISKRPRGIGMAFSALTKTMKMVEAGVEGDGLQCRVEAVDEHHAVALSAVQEEEEVGEFVVRDILREEDNKVDLDG